MKQHLAIGVIAVASLGGVVAPQLATRSAAQAGTVAQTLTGLENDWAKASKAGNADAVAPLLADEFVTMDSDGSMRSKTETLARTKKAKWTANELSDIKVAVHGDTAIVSGGWVGKGTDGAGKAVDAKERWLDTWMKTSGGKWQCIASASAPSK